jgi:superfamily II DNA or RNA helicase
MIANGKLDIKIAVPKAGRNEGIYHEKIGLFYDPYDNVVAFSGSLNETGNGLISNYESIDVSVSWEEGAREKERVRNHIEHFERLWKGTASGLEVVEFPDAIKRALIDKYRPKKPIEKDTSKNNQTDAFPKRRLFEFQEMAIKAWADAGFKGILAMATGSGKTFTSLKALEKYSERIKLAIIVVPSSNLVYQWEKEIKQEYGEEAIIRKAHSEETNWSGKIERIIEWLDTFNSSTKKVFVITTIQTACKESFLRLFENFPEQSLALLVDEVHHSGAPIFRKIFEIKAGFRLGLSATPERDWDDEGNQAVFNYFGHVVYEYDISAAIKEGFLSKYYYYPHVVPLNYEEKEQFSKISRSIATITSQIHSEYPKTRQMTVPQLLQYLENISPQSSAKLRTLFLKRVEIVKKAKNKFSSFREIIRNNKLRRCLVYCNDLSHLDSSIKIVYEEGFEPIEFSSRINPDERKKILDNFERDVNANVFLVAVKCLDEGVDIPACDSAILISCSRSTREFIQRRGRLLRKHSTKEYSTIHDIVILPFTSEKEAYPLTQSELSFIKEELKRIDLLSKNAINSKDFNVDSMNHLYNRFLLA